MLGHTVEEWTWVPDFWLDHLHPDDRERVLAVDAEANRTRRAYSLEYRFRRAEDRYVWLQDEAVFLQPDPTQEGSWQGLLFDVTARKEAEEQLRASELVHSATVEHLPAIIYREPPERSALKDMYISPQVNRSVRLHRRGVDPGRADFWRDRIHPDDAKAVVAANGDPTRRWRPTRWTTASGTGTAAGSGSMTRPRSCRT